MKKYLFILLACFSITLISCNPKTEKVAKELYKDFKKAPNKGKLFRSIYNDTKKEKKNKEKHIEKRSCSKCGGGGYLYSIDYYGNTSSKLCDMCVGTGYMNVVVED
jgi:hypothetical protein